MSSINPKKDFAKRDMNFFAEFTEKSAKMKRYLGFAFVIGFAVIVVVVGVIIFQLIMNQVIQNNINDLKKELASDEYQDLGLEYENLSNTLQTKTDYYFALTSHKANVDSVITSDLDAIRLLEACIPSDTIITGYETTAGVFTVSGQTFSYYSGVEIVNMLNNSDLFNDVEISIIRYDPAENNEEASTYVHNVINNYYEFTITGSIVGDYVVSVVAYNNTDLNALGGVNATSVESGDSYTLENIMTREENGVTYTLESILVNGTTLTEEEFSFVSNNDVFSFVPNSNASIVLNYVNASAATESTEGSES